MILADTIGNVLATAPLAFLFGLLVGAFIGSRYDLRKKGDGA